MSGPKPFTGVLRAAFWQATQLAAVSGAEGDGVGKLERNSLDPRYRSKGRCPAWQDRAWRQDPGRRMSSSGAKRRVLRSSSRTSSR